MQKMDYIQLKFILSEIKSIQYNSFTAKSIDFITKRIVFFKSELIDFTNDVVLNINAKSSILLCISIIQDLEDSIKFQYTKNEFYYFSKIISELLIVKDIYKKLGSS